VCLLKDNRGTIFLEFVMSFIVLLILWAGICNCALLFKERLAVASALREAGREAAVRKDFYAGIDKGYQVLQAAGVPRDRSEVQVYQAAQNLVAAEVTCRSPVALPLMNGMMGGNPLAREIVLHDVKVFRYEETPGG
jgi:Flp pilus assembly protein TadG